MRKIKVQKWKATNSEGEKVDENTLMLLNVLIANKKPEDMPRGLDKFRLFNRLTKAFARAEKGGTLILEETEYKFLKETIEKDVPSAWGLNPNIAEAIEAFLNAKSED